MRYPLHRILLLVACAAAAVTACGKDRDDSAPTRRAAAAVPDAPPDRRECQTAARDPTAATSSSDPALYARCQTAAADAARALCADRQLPDSRQRPGDMDDETCAARWLHGLPERTCTEVTHASATDWTRTVQHWPATDGLLARCAALPGTPDGDRPMPLSCDLPAVYAQCVRTEQRVAREEWCATGKAIERTPSGEPVDCLDFHRHGTPATKKTIHTATEANSGFRETTEDIPAYRNGGWARQCFDSLGQTLVDCLAD